MADPVTNNYSLTLPTVGGDSGTWGTAQNGGIFTPLDAILGGSFAVTITAADVTLTTSQFQNGIFTLSGTLTGNHNLIVPLSPNSATAACGGKFIVQNKTGGNFNVTVKTAASGSVGVVVPQSAAAALYSDTVNVAFDNTGLPATVQAFAGNPNGSVAGTAGSASTNASVVYDYSDNALFLCTTTGTTAATAAWSALAPAPGTVLQSSLAQGAAPLPMVLAQVNDNLHLVNDGTNATRDIDITQGRVRDDSDATNLQLAATMVKRLDTAWAAGGASGSPQGGCDTGTKGNNQTWHAYLIGKLAQTVTNYARAANVATVTIASHGLGVGGSIRVIGIGLGFDGLYAITATTTNTVSYANTGSTISTATAPAGAIADAFDCLFSQSYNSPTMPSGWTVKQCLGSVLTDGSANIRAFTQIGSQFLLTTSVTSVNSASGSTTASLISLNTPNGIEVLAGIRVGATTGSGGGTVMLFSAPDESDQAPTSGGLGNVFVPAASGIGCAEIVVRTNTSAQVRVRASNTTGTYSVFTTYWIDPRRRNF